MEGRCPSPQGGMHPQGGWDHGPATAHLQAPVTLTSSESLYLPTILTKIGVGGWAKEPQQAKNSSLAQPRCQDYGQGKARPQQTTLIKPHANLFNLYHPDLNAHVTDPHSLTKDCWPALYPF